MLIRLGRQQAPVLTADVSGPTSLVQGVYANRLGQPTEGAIVARDFLAAAIDRNGIEPHTIHADRGGSMVSKPVSEMLVNLGVLRSHSRPRTSHDNPYSEAQFKTMKYVPDFPDRFGSLADARAFYDGFFTAYIS